MLEVLQLRGYPAAAPLVRIAGRAAVDLEDVAAVGLEETPDLLQRHVEERVHVAAVIVEQAGAMGDELLDVGVEDKALFRDVIGDVVGDLQTGLAPLEVDDGIVEIEMTLEQGIETAPGPAAELTQLLVGAEVAGLVQPLQHLVALAARAVLDMEALPAGPVGIEQIVRFQIRDIDKVVKTIKCGGQHETTPTSQGGTGCLEKHAVHSAFRGRGPAYG